MKHVFFQALLLALQKLKLSEEQRKCSIEAPEPLAVFALSCGLYSSPAVLLPLTSFPVSLSIIPFHFIFYKSNIFKFCFAIKLHIDLA